MNRRRFQAWYLLLALLVVGAILAFRPTQIFDRSPPDWIGSNPLDKIGQVPPASSPKNKEVPLAPRAGENKKNPLGLVAAGAKPAKALPPAEIEQARGGAKVALAANYAAQKSFFSEYRRYSTDLYASGWRPSELPLAYKAGFLAPYFPAQLLPEEDPRRMDTDAILAEHPARDGGPFYTPATEAISLAGLSAQCRSGCTASEHGFEMLVAFNLDADPTLEVWRINEKKELEQVVNDLAE